MWQLEQVLGQRQRRRPRLDPAKIDVNHVTGDENVSVVNRASGKRITGAKAPPIRYLKEWLLRNPEYDVDPKWGHIVKAKAIVAFHLVKWLQIVIVVLCFWVTENFLVVFLSTFIIVIVECLDACIGITS